MAANGNPNHGGRYFPPTAYRENPQTSADTAESTFWDPDTDYGATRYQEGVYKWAASLIKSNQAMVIDIGCGTGHKLAGIVAPVSRDWLGVDQESAISIASRECPQGNWLCADLSQPEVWADLAELRADLVICSDVIEHLLDPLELVQRLGGLIGPTGHALVSTPDRSRLEGRDPLGPPLNPLHIREWIPEEFKLLVESAGLEVVEMHHFFPRGYSPTVANFRRLVKRALQFQALPDRRNTMTFLLRTA
ncbi:Methyltransferase domain [Actinobacteria bacterium IMCC26207]|nr:Methyltransferase domain [Actinobacteria bacterium IMCC26207]